MSLADHAERELRAAGLFDEDSDYGGMLGPAVLDLVKAFAAQGHSGLSAHIAIDLFRRVASYQILTPLRNPMKDGQYIEVAPGTLQSTRKSSVFSEDGGKRWYDIDKHVPRWKRMLGVRRHYITFATFPADGGQGPERPPANEKDT